MSGLAKEFAGKRVKDVPAIVSKLAGENLAPEVVKSRVGNWYSRYKTEQFDGNTLKPLTDFLAVTFLFSYAFSWPTEYAHMKHEQEAKLKGEKH